MHRALSRILIPAVSAAALLLPVAAPIVSAASVWHCASCSCTCTLSTAETRPWPGDGTDPAGICRTDCTSYCSGAGFPGVTESRGVECSVVPGTEGTGDTGGTTNTNAPGAPDGPRGAPVTPLPNPLGGSTDISTIIGRIINAALGISGSIALLMFIWGGVLWLTSGGSPERIQKGKNTIVWAVLGLVLIFGSYAILNFVLGAILGAA